MCVCMCVSLYKVLLKFFIKYFVVNGSTLYETTKDKKDKIW